MDTKPFMAALVASALLFAGCVVNNPPDNTGDPNTVIIDQNNTVIDQNAGLDELSQAVDEAAAGLDDANALIGADDESFVKIDDGTFR
ncbi:MAG TPA: hypothetical protein HA254_00145 [Candidatus Diapherotrites archaeon]|uniref:Uncharacterized protein n=1 Tax=Candidatus Iainarchaeum sp. TaxID=3101447 RepID=A0A7J4IW57_9ARCH|nr:hypothetical protein [Candidatus Diapherotrites archaeon]